MTAPEQHKTETITGFEHHATAYRALSRLATKTAGLPVLDVLSHHVQTLAETVNPRNIDFWQEAAAGPAETTIDSSLNRVLLRTALKGLAKDSRYTAAVRTMRGEYVPRHTPDFVPLDDAVHVPDIEIRQPESPLSFTDEFQQLVDAEQVHSSRNSA